MKTFALKVITPKGAVIDKPVSGLYLRGSEGDLAIFAGHVPFVTAVVKGNCAVITAEGERKEGVIEEEHYK